MGFEKLRAQARHGGMGNLPLRFGAQYRQWGYGVGENPIEEKTFSSVQDFIERLQIPVEI